MNNTIVMDAAKKLVSNLSALNANLEGVAISAGAAMTNSYEGKVKVDEIAAGESTQLGTTGAQLLNISNENVLIAQDGTINASSVGSCAIVDVSSLTSVYISGDFTLLDNELIRVGLCTDYPMVGGDAVRTEWTKNAAANVSNYNYLLLTFVSATGITIDSYRNSFMLNEGSTALPWEPYTGGKPSPSPDYPQEIKKTVISEIKTRGKNLLKITITSMTHDGITLTVNGDKSISITGQNSALLTRPIGKVELKAGASYIISGCPVGGGNASHRVDLRTFSGDVLIDSVNNGGDILFTATKNIEAYYTIRLAAGFSATNMIFYPMVREASVTDDAYEPYTESVVALSKPIELYGIGDAQDRIVYKDGVIGVERNLHKYALQGDETWSTYTHAESGVKRSFYTNATMKFGTRNILCNYAAAIGWTNMQKTLNCCSAYENYFGFTLDTIQDFTTSEEMNTYIKSLEKPIETIYELATPEFKELPIADQMALNSVKTFDGATYVEFDSEIQPAFVGEYGATKMGGMVLENMLTTRNNDMRLAAIEASMVNNI